MHHTPQEPKMNPHPIYRRRRRIALLAVVTIFAVGFALVPDDADGRDACRFWPDVPPCTESVNR